MARLMHLTCKHHMVSPWLCPIHLGCGGGSERHERHIRQCLSQPIQVPVLHSTGVTV